MSEGYCTWVTLPLLVFTASHSYSFGEVVCPSRAAAPRHDWDRPTRRLPSSRRVAADVRVTRVERFHHAYGPPTCRRIAQSQHAMWLLPTRVAGLRPAVTGGRRSTVWENIEQPAAHSVPATSTSIAAASQKYNLRRRKHDRQLHEHQGHLSDCNFITRLFYKNSY